MRKKYTVRGASVTRLEAVEFFLEQLLLFRDLHSESIDLFFEPILQYTKIKSSVEFDTQCIDRINNLYGTNAAQRIYNLKFEPVKVISTMFPFFRAINKLDRRVTGIYNMLDNTTLYTDFFVPQEMIFEKCQKDIYLLKSTNSIL